MTSKRSPNAVALALLLLATPLPARSQDPPAVVEGRILSAGSGVAVPGVLVRFAPGLEAVADDEGRFLIEGLEAGIHGLTLVTPDCRISHGEMEVAAGTLHRVELHVPGTVMARAPAPPEERERDPGALVLTAGEIEEMRARNVTEVVRRVMPGMVASAGGRVGEYDRLQGRTINSFMDRTPPVVVVDGVRVADGAETLDQLQPSDVEHLEILRGASGGWAFGSSGAAGAILVTTRRGVRSGTPPSDGRSRVPPDARRCPIPDRGAGVRDVRRRDPEARSASRSV